MEELVKEIKKSFNTISNRQLKLGWLLNEIYKSFEDYEFQEAYGTFPAFIAESGKSVKQVRPFMNAAQWVKENGLTLEDVQDIPITKLNLMVKYQVPLTDDLLYDLRELAYSDLQIMYGGKAEYEYDKETM